MKAALAILSALFCLPTLGQDYITNWVTSSNLMDVEGKVIAKDKRVSLEIKPIEVRTNGLLAWKMRSIPGQRYTIGNAGAASGGFGTPSYTQILGYQEDYQLMILNAPILPETRRSSIYAFRLNRLIDGLEAWDVGKPHMTPIVTRSRELYQRQRQAEAGPAQAAAFTFWKEKAEAGDGLGQLKLGGFYLRGEGTETNLDLARKWLWMAATNGHPEAAELLTNSPAK